MSDEPSAQLRAFLPEFRWEGVENRPYKEEGSAPFRAIARQVLFTEEGLDCELRYFEMAAGGYSTLERHKHMHGVMILRGHGHCLLGDEVRAVKPFDLVTIPAWTWHQFRASGDEPLGFLCMVNRERDRPQLPSEAELAALKSVPEVAAFLAG
ncbi:MAG TPA: cupin domain-containing protein [Acetobacteraceae bacterium]|nr:cupin domain-containing protein [Acetobacteraceae bacterium]